VNFYKYIFGKDIYMKIEIDTEKAPKAIGPYSQGLDTGTFVFTSGQIPANPETGRIESEKIVQQTRQALENLKNVIISSGSDMSKVIKTTLYIKNMDDFHIINEIYSEYFSKPYPVRSCVEVARLPKDALIEIDAVATK